MTIRHIYIAAVIGLFALAGCKSNTEVSTEDTTEIAGDSSASRQDSMQPHENRANREEMAARTEEWNNSLSMLHIADLPKFYADEVQYYGKMMSRDEVVQLKKDYLMANPDIEKNSLAGVAVELLPNGVTRVNFTRSLQTKKGVSVTNGYIVFKEFPDGWKITIESDIEADVKRIEMASRPMNTKEIKSCDNAAEAIFRSSPMVQAMLRAPNSSYKIEYKPGDPDNPNRRYWFWVFGSPIPGGHVDTYGRFQVDPQTGQLYQFDPVQDKTSPIPSDAALKKYITKYCGK
jgi:hypothetical protein